MSAQSELPASYPGRVYENADYLYRPDSPPHDKALPLIREALLYNPDAYRAMRNRTNAAGRGAFILLVIVLLVAVAQLVGLAIGLLTSPRIDLLQDRLYDGITGMAWFANRVAVSPEMGQRFNMAYEGVWQGIRLTAGYPTWSTTAAVVALAVLGTFINWLVYGTLAHGTARWLGGQATFGQWLGSLALAYAPLLLTMILMIPGATIGVPLIFLALLTAKYVAIKTTYGLAPARSLVATIFPYLIVTLIAVTAAIFGVAYGIGQIPYIDPILRGLLLITRF